MKNRQQDAPSPDAISKICDVINSHTGDTGTTPDNVVVTVENLCNLLAQAQADLRAADAMIQTRIYRK